jgi:hypothetical protein
LPNTQQEGGREDGMKGFSSFGFLVSSVSEYLREAVRIPNWFLQPPLLSLSMSHVHRGAGSRENERRL